MQIAFTGGGTGGHVFPGIAVINALENSGIGKDAFVWIGSGKGIEKEIVSRFGYRYRSIPSGKWRRYFSIANFFDLFKIFAGFVKVFFLFLFHRPVLLFSKGGYVSVPPVWAAHLLRIPVLTHESDLTPGLATRLNARFSDKIFVPYEETKNALKKYGEKVVVSGNPVRPEIFRGDAAKGRKISGAPDGVPLILVSGGSQGAAVINAAVVNALDRLCAQAFVVHQTGSSGEEIAHSNYFSRPFFHEEFPHLLAAADVTVCRAGAGTLWENGVTGTPAVLIPLGHGTRGDQAVNARLFEQHGAAVVVTEDELSNPEWVKAVESLLLSPNLKENMSRAARELCRPDAAEFLAAEIQSVLKRRKK